jgi:DNA-binding SARP family transcriptional activator
MKLRLATLLFALAPAPLCAADELQPEVRALLDGALAGATGQEDVLHRVCILAHGRVQPLLDALALERENGEGARRRAAARLEAHFLWRRGDLDLARQRYAELAEDGEDLAAALAHAKLLDALGRTDEALRAYEALLPRLDAQAQAFLRLRMALMSMTSGDEAGQDALAEFASAEDSPVDVRNRAAIVLALLGRPDDAIALYEVEGEDAARFKGEVRVAEWAVRAGDAATAQGAAWRAVRAATLKRDRRYALTVLVEAHRMDDSLGALIERFAAASALSAEEREVWIALLRETERFDEALALFQSARGAGDETFTVEMRRELLEMYREAGQAEQMVAGYLELVAAEPERTAWREGLARYYLERGDRAAAVEVWRTFIENGEELLLGAETLRGLGLDDEAMRCAELCVERDAERFPALLFLYALHRDRGELDRAEATLRRLDELAPADAPVRMELSEAWEQLGRLEQAVHVLEGVVAARDGEELSEDLAMRLAWLYSEVGEEERAMEAWRALWLRVKSVPRRRYVEDRMMTVAARLGTLADIAVDLEQKLVAGTATQSDSGLLVRLYTKVGDAVSAGEVIDEFLEASGGSQIEALQEKARVYLTCTDFYSYEKTVRRLIEVDPEGEDEYLRQLAMSQLERGRPDEAREVLELLKTLDVDTDAAEFEAGVLALSGMRAEAVSAYHVGLAAHPERIDSYLLMAGLMKQLGQADRAVGMFQHLAETAERDDLFTIAIDGLLNMLVDAPPRPDMLAWARRITLERLARRHDKMYLYQLLSDLAEEAQDREGMLTALENSLATSGARRTSVLRELMDIAKGQGDSFMGRGWAGDSQKHLAYGRRLIGVGEAVPPGVYLDLGEAFLDADDPASAAKTFRLARDLPDEQVFRRQTAGLFEKAGFVEDALETFEAVLVTQPTDVSLLVKVGELHEMLGDDGLASELYLQALDLLMKRRPLSTEKVEEEQVGRNAWWAARNVDDFDQYYGRVLGGVLASVARERAEGLVAAQREAIARDLESVGELRAANAEASVELGQYPRLARRAQYLRRLAGAYGFAAAADALDRRLLAEFPDDEGLLEELVRERLRWGLVASARGLIGASGRDAAATRPLLALVGEGVESELTRPVPLAEAVWRVLPLLVDGRADDAQALLSRVSFGDVAPDALPDVTALFSAARFLGDPGLCLRVGREWVRLQVKHGQGSYQVEPVLETVASALDRDGRKALYQFFVTTILQDPDKSASYVTLLPKLQTEFEEPLLDEEQVLEMLDGYGERGAWGLAPVLVLLPAPERAGVLRSIWPKVEKTRRAMFLLQLVGDFEEELGAELESFVVEVFPGTLDDADDFYKYYVRNLLDSEHNASAALAMADALAGKQGEDAQLMALRALKLKQRGEAELGAERAAEALLRIAEMESDEYDVVTAQRKLTETFLPDELERFVAALDARVAENGASVPLALLRIDLHAQAEDEAGERSALEAGLAAFPDDVELVTRLRTVHQREGRALDALRAQERLVALEEDDDKRKGLRQDLVRRWKALGHFEEALVAFEALEAEGGANPTASGPLAGLPAGAMMIINGVVHVAGEEGPKGLPMTIEAVKRSIDDGAPEEARATLRRLWRQFPSGEETNMRFFGARYSPMASLRWPRDASERTPEDEARAERAARGGLDAFDEVRPPEVEPPASAYEELARYDFAVAELERFLRTQEPSQLDRLQALYEGLFAARARVRGEDAALEELLADVRAGSADKIDYVLLLAALDAAPERTTPEIEGVLRDLLRTLNPKDAAQIRRLARVWARAGAREEALVLYRWCATRVQATTVYFFGEEDGTSRVSAQELVKDAKEVLEGDDRIALIEAVLSFARPSDVPWQRESFEVLTIDTWEELLGPAEALARARRICDESCDLSTGLRRRVALRAATLLANAGDLARARRALEIGLCELDPSEVKQPSETWYRVYPERPGYLGHDDLRRMFPPSGGALADPLGWYRVVAESMGAWLAEGRVSETAAVQALALAAVRLAEAGDEELGQTLLQDLAARESLSPSLCLWVADASRRAGIGHVGDGLERRLLDEGRLTVSRAHEVVQRTLQVEGPAAALELGAHAASYTRRPALIEVLVTAADAAGQPDLAEEWRQRGASAAAAETKLEELEKAAAARG